MHPWPAGFLTLLFDYEMHHIPASSHSAVDSLSRRKCTSEDSKEEDTKDFLNKFICFALLESPTVVTLTNFLSSQLLFTFRPTRLNKYFFQDLLLTMRKIPRTPYASFYSTFITDDLSILNIEDPTPSWAEELQRIGQACYDPSEKDTQDGSLAKYSLLSVVDDFSYTGSEFEYQRVCIPTMVEYTLGRETCIIKSTLEPICLY